MRVYPMKSSRGNAVKNQFIIEDNNGHTYLQSYRSIVAVIRFDGTIELDKTYWNYSRTTARYRNIFLNETTQETQQKINSGQYHLSNLN